MSSADPEALLAAAERRLRTRSGSNLDAPRRFTGRNKDIDTAVALASKRITPQALVSGDIEQDVTVLDEAEFELCVDYVLRSPALVCCAALQAAGFRFGA